MMKRLGATTAALLMLGGAALAQSSGGGAGSTTTPPGSFNPTPNTPVTPGITTPSPSGGTTGRGPGVNPSNPQDMIGRSNPQDMTSPRAKNPQDAGTSGAPRIMVPER